MIKDKGLTSSKSMKVLTSLQASLGQSKVPPAMKKEINQLVGITKEVVIQPSKRDVIAYRARDNNQEDLNDKHRFFINNKRVNDRMHLIKGAYNVDQDTGKNNKTFSP